MGSELSRRGTLTPGFDSRTIHRTIHNWGGPALGRIHRDDLAHDRTNPPKMASDPPGTAVLGQPWALHPLRPLVSGILPGVHASGSTAVAILMFLGLILT